MAAFLYITKLEWEKLEPNDRILIYQGNDWMTGKYLNELIQTSSKVGGRMVGARQIRFKQMTAKCEQND